MTSEMHRYIARGQKRVQGWLDPFSARMIGTLSEFQAAQGLSGAVGEIGIHHGRLFILLALSAMPGEKAFAVDVFERQDLNTDKSGMGDRAMFEANLRRFGLAPEDILIIAGSSLEVSGADLVDTVGPIRMISIDGGHTEQCVLNDLAIADEALSGHGIVIIDDVFNSCWPSVVSGYARYLLDSPATIPFASSPNKVYACRPEFADVYRSHLRTAYADRFDRADRLFGFPLESYGMRSPPTILGRVAYKARWLRVKLLG